MITRYKFSQHRRYLSSLVDKIHELAFLCADSPESLIQGTPGEVFRTCGQKNCKCATDPDSRHGPYLVIQIYQNQKQRQVVLKKSEKEFWQKAKNYQQHMKILSELK